VGHPSSSFLRFLLVSYQVYIWHFVKKKIGLTEIINYIFYIEGFERKKLNRIHVKL